METIREKAGFNYAMKHYSNNSVEDIKKGLESFDNCERYRKDTEWNRGLKAGFEHLIRKHNESS